MHSLLLTCIKTISHYLSKKSCIGFLPAGVLNLQKIGYHCQFLLMINSVDLSYMCSTCSLAKYTIKQPTADQTHALTTEMLATETLTANAHRLLSFAQATLTMNFSESVHKFIQYSCTVYSEICIVKSQFAAEKLSFLIGHYFSHPVKLICCT